jgi:hypothetical protein
MTLNSNLTPKGIVEIPPKETRDLYLAAALHAEGCKYLGIDRTDPTRMVFKFEGGENADRIEREWYQGSCIGSYSVYSQSIRTMKTLIHT